MTEALKKLAAALEEAGGCIEDLEGYETVDEGEWIDDGKYSFCTTVVMDSDHNYYAIDQSRSGSYHTDYYYGDPSFREVVPEEVVTVIYVNKGKAG